MMKTLLLTVAAVLSLSAASCASPYQSPPPSRPDMPIAGTYAPALSAGEYRVEVREGVWRDRRRSGARNVAWKAYLPDASAGAVPIVVWSHGLGGSRNGSESLGRHLASHGFAAFHIQHPGSDADAMRALGPQGVLQSFRDNPRSVLDRFCDVPFALDQIYALANGELRGRLDPRRAGISGHSFGALTTMTIAGQKGQRRIVGQRFSDDRFLAAFAMSPSAPSDGSAQNAFSDMKMPVFHLTGTQDGSPVDNRLSPADRLIPFQVIDNVDQHLLVLNGGTHFTFSDRTQFQGSDYGYPSLERHRQLVRVAAVAYWDAYLNSDEAARLWLSNGGYASLVAREGDVRYKPALR